MRIQTQNFLSGLLQEKVVALTCLAEYTKQLNVNYGLTVNVTALHNRTFHKLFHITKNNYEITQRAEA